MAAWKFIGRRRELAELERQYAAETSNLVPVYGRRRVGKSELILHFKAGRPGVYFVGKPAPAGLQIQEFLAAAAQALDQPLLARARLDGWRATLAEVVRAWRHPGKLILALDEFQWMAGEDPSLPAAIQELWDREWQHSGKLMLILAGSYVGFMEREVLGSRQPLGGRRTGQILLQPFPFWEAAQFHPRYSREDQARAYFITGGVPLYLLAFHDTRSVEQNIRETFLNEFSPLAREPEFLLREELRGLDKFQAVLDALASGRLALREIARQLGVDARAIAYQLETLAGLGYVRRDYPLSARRPTSRDLRFSLHDALLRFWYRFIFPQQSRVRENPQAAFQDRIAGELETFFGAGFERLCRDALAQWYRRELPGTSCQVGEYWRQREVQIDVVGLRDDNWADLGECKWGTVPSLTGLAAELETKIQLYPNPNHASVGRLLFTRRPAKTRLPGVRHFCLDELYALEDKSSE